MSDRLLPWFLYNLPCICRACFTLRGRSATSTGKSTTPFTSVLRTLQFPPIPGFLTTKRTVTLDTNSTISYRTGSQQKLFINLVQEPQWATLCSCLVCVINGMNLIHWLRNVSTLCCWSICKSMNTHVQISSPVTKNKIKETYFFFLSRKVSIS